MSSVSLTQILIFTRQFSSMIGSQLQLSYVLENLAKETPNRFMRDTIERILDDVLNGTDLGDAFEEHPKVFNDIYVNVVRAGMEAGMLGNALDQIGEYLEVADQMRRKVRAALSYPIFMIAAFFIVFNVQVILILPKFQKMFGMRDAPLPAPTQLMITIGDFYLANWYFLIIGFVGTIVGFIVWVSTREGRVIWDEIKLKIPVVGGAFRMASLSRLLRTLAVQVENKVPLVVALELSASASGNHYIEGVIIDIVEDIRNGEGIADSFRAHDVFSGIVLQMISSGEESGEFDRLLKSAASYFDDLLAEQLDSMTGMINPILTVFVGTAIAGMMVAAFLPVFQMSSTM
jgi:type II secretory pathway component PulF